MNHIGNFGHSAILIPASLTIILCLLWYDRRADALAVAAALGACLVATLIAKIAFQSCESQFSTLGIESPSGHASVSAAFYGCAALLVAAGRGLWMRACILAGAAAFVVLVGLSRIYVGVHTVPEVIAGMTIGAASLFVFQWLRGPKRRLVVPLRLIAIGIPVAAVLALTILTFARNWTLEYRIEKVAGRLDRMFNYCAPM